MGKRAPYSVGIFGVWCPFCGAPRYRYCATWAPERKPPKFWGKAGRPHAARARLAATTPKPKRRRGHG